MPKQFIFGFTESINYTVAITAETADEALEKFDNTEYDDHPNTVDSGYPSRSVYAINNETLPKPIPDYYDRYTED